MNQNNTPAPKRILVVDDHKQIQQTLPFLLQEEGYEVKVAGNGEQAFQIACQGGVQLVLTDISMPDVSGIELIRLMKQDHFLRSVPVIAMTAFGSERCAEARDAGATVCLEKPLDHEELLRLIAKFTRTTVP